MQWFSDPPGAPPKGTVQGPSSHTGLDVSLSKKDGREIRWARSLGVSIRKSATGNVCAVKRGQGGGPSSVQGTGQTEEAASIGQEKKENHASQGRAPLNVTAAVGGKPGRGRSE